MYLQNYCVLQSKLNTGNVRNMYFNFSYAKFSNFQIYSGLNSHRASRLQAHRNPTYMNTLGRAKFTHLSRLQTQRNLHKKSVEIA